ncbi:MAG: MerR family transcriptional regulator [Anaerolineae bacterium]
MFKIGDFSKICRVPVSALRYYADIGLLEPAQIDSFTGYRYYSLNQLPRLNRIIALKDLGLTLEEIGRLLNEDVSPEELRGMFRLQQTKIQQQVEEEQARLARVAARLKQIELEGKMPQQEVVLKTLEAQHVLSVRQVIAKPQHVATLLEESFDVLMPAGVQITGAPFVIFHDEEFKPADLDVEAVFPVTPNVQSHLEMAGGRQLKAHELAGVPLAACVVHVGGFDKIHESYSGLANWIEANGYRFAGPSREVYLSPPEGDNPAITEIQWPVEKI